MTTVIENTETTYIPATDGVIVYTKNGCMPCKMTMKKMDKAGIDYTTVNMDETPEAIDYIKGLGHMSAPVVVASKDDHWSGLRPDRIEELKISLA